MATMLAKIIKIPRSEYQQIPPLFSDSKRGNGDAEKANNYGHHRYCIFGQNVTFSISVSLFVLSAFLVYSDRAKSKIRNFLQNSASSASKKV